MIRQASSKLQLTLAIFKPDVTARPHAAEVCTHNFTHNLPVYCIPHGIRIGLLSKLQFKCSVVVVFVVVVCSAGM